MNGRVACAGAVVLDASGRLLLIKRRNPPAAGTWSLPGGRCEPGESPEQACVREVAEETGLTVRVLRLVGRVERDGPGGVVYDIDDFECELLGGSARAGDDAADVAWVTRAQFEALSLAPLLAETLSDWGCLPET